MADRGGKRDGAGRKSLEAKLKSTDKISTRSKVFSVRIPESRFQQFLEKKGGNKFLRQLFFDYCCSAAGRREFVSFVEWDTSGQRESKAQTLLMLDELERQRKERRLKK